MLKKLNYGNVVLIKIESLQIRKLNCSDRTGYCLELSTALLLKENRKGTTCEAFKEKEGNKIKIDMMRTAGVAVLARTIETNGWPSHPNLRMLERHLSHEFLKTFIHKKQTDLGMLNSYAITC